MLAMKLARKAELRLAASRMWMMDADGLPRRPRRLKRSCGTRWTFGERGCQVFALDTPDSTHGKVDEQAVAEGGDEAFYGIGFASTSSERTMDN